MGADLVPSVFVQNLEAAAKLTELVLGNMEGIARASQSIAQFGPAGGSTLVIGGSGGEGGGNSGAPAAPGGSRIGMGGGGGAGGGAGVTYGAAGSAFLRSQVVPESRDAAAIVSVLQGLPGAIARELNKNSLGNILRSTGGL